MRKKKHPEHVNHERWLVSYADFITLLFAFFTTLYAISTVDQKKAGKLMFSMLTALNIDFFPTAASSGSSGSSPVPNAENNPSGLALVGRPGPGKGGDTASAIKRITGNLVQLSKLPGLSGKMRVRQERRGLVVSLAEAGFFESGSAGLQKGAIEALDAIAAELIKKGDLELVVEGHTDNRPVRGRYHNNWELSTARATFVVAFLVEKHHMDPTTLAAAGYGEYKPAADNTTAEGRARNRRVDIVIRAPVMQPIDPSPSPPPPAAPAAAPAHSGGATPTPSPAAAPTQPPTAANPPSAAAEPTAPSKATPSTAPTRAPKTESER